METRNCHKTLQSLSATAKHKKNEIKLSNRGYSLMINDNSKHHRHVYKQRPKANIHREKTSSEVYVANLYDGWMDEK